MLKFAYGRVVRLMVMALCAALFVPSMPVNYLSISGRGRELLSCPMPSAWAFESEYIHSLQLTPVRDDFRFVSGRMWDWEEWTRSFNAGLPSVLSPHMKLAHSGEWMVFRGGRRTHEVLYYRIGHRKGKTAFGLNKWRVAPWDVMNVFEMYPSYRAEFRTFPKAFGKAEVKGLGELPNHRGKTLGAAQTRRGTQSPGPPFIFLLSPLG